MKATSTSPSARRDASLLAISTTLASLQRSYRAAVDKAVAHLGLSQALALPLVVIGRHGDGLRPGMLAVLLGIEGPSLVRSLAQLTRSNLVEYRKDLVDGRAKTLSLTPAGVVARERIEAVLLEMRRGLYDGIADDDLSACLRVFATLEQRLGRRSMLANAGVDVYAADADGPPAARGRKA